MSFIKYIADENHYKEVLSLVCKAKQTRRDGNEIATKKALGSAALLCKEL